MTFTCQIVTTSDQPYLSRIPVRTRDEIILVPVENVVAIVAEGELIHFTTIAGERHTMTYRLEDIECRLDPANFVRLPRGSIINIDAIRRVRLTPGSSYIVELTNGHEIAVSRLQARVLRHRLLAL